MKICIIGNSHIAALKVALRDRLIDPIAADVVFWGAVAKVYRDIRYESGRLMSPIPQMALFVSDGRYKTIDPEDFGALVFHGAPVEPTDLLRKLRRHTTDLRHYSSAFLRNGIAEHFDTMPTCQIIQKIRQTYRGRVLVSPQPLIAEQSNFFSNQKFQAEESAALDDTIHRYFERYDVEYVPQPAATIAQRCYTVASYCVNSIDLSGADLSHQANNYSHMNGLYGREVLQSIIHRLGC